jgi:hypothetical protein
MDEADGKNIHQELYAWLASFKRSHRRAIKRL